MGLESGLQFAIGTGLNYRQSKRAQDLAQAQAEEMSAVRKAVEERARRAQASGDFEAFAGALAPFEQLFPDAAPEEMRVIRESGATDPVAALRDPNVLTARGRAMEKYAPLWRQRQDQQRTDTMELAKARHPMNAVDRFQLERTKAVYQMLLKGAMPVPSQGLPIVQDPATGQARFMSLEEWNETWRRMAADAANQIGDTAPPGYPASNPGGFSIAAPQPSPFPPASGAPAAAPSPAPAKPAPTAGGPSPQKVAMRAPPAPKGDGKVYRVLLKDVPNLLTEGWTREK